MARATRSRRQAATGAGEIEALPEADRLSPFPHPRHTERLLGHAAAQTMIGVAIASGQCHHAWLISGPPGIGKATLAYKVARFALSDPDARGEAAKLECAEGGLVDAQIAALSHPGLMVLRRPYDPKDKRFKRVITVDEVRRVKGFLTHTAAAGGWRIVIVDAADEMNVAAANALLKTLEEPPPRTLFLLICGEPGRLLATVRSRCRRLTLSGLTDEETRAAAEAASQAAEEPVVLPEGVELDRLVTEAEGRPGRLLMLVAGGGHHLTTAVDEVFKRLPAVDWTSAHALAGDVAGSGQTSRFDLLVDLILERIRCDARARLDAPSSANREPGGRASQASLAAWAALWDTILDDKRRVDELNLDRKTFVLTVLERLAATARV